MRIIPSSDGVYSCTLIKVLGGLTSVALDYYRRNIRETKKEAVKLSIQNHFANITLVLLTNENQRNISIHIQGLNTDKTK